jgi:hypothetical protein
MTRPPAALVHDELWRGPIGAGRKKLYRLEEPDTRCRACSDWSTADRPRCHHRHYRYHTGLEKAGTLVWLCDYHHRRVHIWHDWIFPNDRWPYRWLGVTTSLYILARAPIRIGTYGNDRVRYRTPRWSER